MIRQEEYDNSSLPDTMTPREADLRLRLKTFPRDAFAWYMLGKHLRTRGRHKEAEEALRKAVSINPGPSRFWEELASVLMDLGQLDEAYALADRIREGSASSKDRLASIEKKVDEVPSPCVSCEHYTYYGCSKGSPCLAFTQWRAKMLDKPASS